MVTTSNCRSANGVRAPSCAASAGTRTEDAAGQRFPTSSSMPLDTSQPVNVGPRAQLRQHTHEVAGAAAIVEHGKSAALQAGLAAQQPARLHGDELVGANRPSCA